MMFNTIAAELLITVTIAILAGIILFWIIDIAFLTDKWLRLRFKRKRKDE